MLQNHHVYLRSDYFWRRVLYAFFCVLFAAHVSELKKFYLFSDFIFLLLWTWKFSWSSWMCIPYQLNSSISPTSTTVHFIDFDWTEHRANSSIGDPKNDMCIQLLVQGWALLLGWIAESGFGGSALLWLHLVTSNCCRSVSPSVCNLPVCRYYPLCSIHRSSPISQSVS